MEKITLSRGYPSALGARKAVERALMWFILVFFLCVAGIAIATPPEADYFFSAVIVFAAVCVAYRGWYGATNTNYQTKCLYREIEQYEESIALRQNEKEELLEYVALPDIRKKDEEWIRFYEDQIDQLKSLIQKQPLPT